ncbi:MAG: PEP-CTERM sorting domain-containing protein [Pirellulales bacterium]|nr:PEP-CTERM sorting domain-containing protein [Pirellulales bacterium]
MRYSTVLSGILVCSLLALPASNAGATVVRNLATGIDDVTSLKIANLAPDGQWIFGPGSQASFVGVTPVAADDTINPVLWLSDAASADSRWIIPFDKTHNDNAVLAGTYNFDTLVDLTGFDPTTASMRQLRYAADNRLERILVNGVEVWANLGAATEEFASWNSLPDFLGLGFFQPGVNALRFEVTNFAVDCTPCGLRLEGNIQAVPEPSSLVLAGLGVAGVLSMRWQRRRR